MSVRLIRPGVEYLDEPDEFHKWRLTIFQDFVDQERGIGLPEGYVAHSTFWLVDGSEYVGTGHIRHRLTEALEAFGGHIGYVIRPSRWNMGYGTIQLSFLLKKACAMGIDPALMTCDLDNPASQRVMVKNGANLIDITERVINGEARMICRYQAPTCKPVSGAGILKS